jgi:pyruvate formate lyase activating enzyme
MILDNAKKIVHELHIPLSARIPLIPGYNDDFDNIAATAKFIKNELDKSIKVHVLPYHRLGETKYERMESPEKIAKIDPPTEEHQEEIRKIFEALGLEAVIGG